MSCLLGPESVFFENHWSEEGSGQHMAGSQSSVDSEQISLEFPAVRGKDLDAPGSTQSGQTARLPSQR